MKTIITIDGSAGTGKTTIAKEVAKRLKLPYFDSGAMYRSVTHLLLEKKISFSDTTFISRFLEDFHFEIRMKEDQKAYFVNGIDLSSEIRSQRVNHNVSAVAALPMVRQALLKIQKNFAKKQGGVFEGRDMGTVVFPEARCKIFLTASPEVRAERRLEELKQKRPQEAEGMDLQQMAADLKRRDGLDSTRAIAPLRCPEGAYVIDTSNLTIEEVVERILEYYEQKQSTPPWLSKGKISFLYRLVVFLAWSVLKVFYRLRVYGLDHFYPRGAIIASNHTSFLDPPILSVSWPQEVHFLARETLFKKGGFGALIRALNAHPVTGSAGDVKVFKTICSLLQEGKKVILFPEGARAEDGNLQPLKPGVSMIVSRAQAAVIPAYIQGAYKIWPRGQPIPLPFGRIVCVFGSPITWQSFEHLEKKEAQEAFLKKIEESIKGLKTWLDEGATGIPP